ncbi:putative intracellular protease/amidase [Arthrobacter woluwensis]|uniref:type 1 glutamine amidotransferase domain-containing protein n=1 Tax=Arthrobacter woluwensis TaxID=156980 RepID=UPI00278433C2|nr:type 1 glutamine amidotransferase domain-containing protein [Arthrobacter woluwensis]MDQ0709609.1 putative intracellular protease/amidase [Arthrobacter woluwensis]
MSSILMVLSAATELRLSDGTLHPTGFWAEEVAEPHRLFSEAGLTVIFATPGGVVPTVDPASLSEQGGVEPEAAARFRAYLDGIAPALENPVALEDTSLEHIDALFLPGGHAPMADLVDHPGLGALLADADRDGLPITALCHGLAGLLSARNDDGFLFAGRRLTSFSDVEEQQGGLGELSPFLLESRLRESGAVVATDAPWSSHLVIDGNLLTGQNPQSSAVTANALIDLLSA